MTETPDLFQSVPQIKVDVVSQEHPIMQGLQNLGDSAIAAIDAFMNRLTGAVMGGLAGMSGGDRVFSTGRTEDPGFAPSAPVIAAAVPARASGQSIDGRSTPALAREVSDTQSVGKYEMVHVETGTLVQPNVSFSKGPSQDRGIAV
jgi:hypothetical protein